GGCWGGAAAGCAGAAGGGGGGGAVPGGGGGGGLAAVGPPPAGIDVLPLEGAAGVELEQQGALCPVPAVEGLVVPPARDGVAAVRCLDDRGAVGHVGGCAAAAQGGEGVLPGQAAVRAEPYGQHLGGGGAAGRCVVGAGRHVAAVGGLLDGVEVRRRCARWAEVFLPLDVAGAVQLEDQRAGVLIGAGEAAGRDVAAVGGLPDLVDDGAGQTNGVDPCPG